MADLKELGKVIESDLLIVGGGFAGLVTSIRAAQEKDHLFHIHIETESAASRAIFGRWQRLLPGHTASIQRKDINCISDLMTAIIGVTSGKSVNEALNQMEPTAAEKIARSMSLIHIGQQQTKRLSF